MNDGNLRPIGTGNRSKKEEREIQARGGRKSGETRRRKRDQRQMMTAMLKAVPDLDRAAIENLKRLGFQGKGEKKDQYSIEIISMAALLQKVMRGDTRAYRLMLEILGEDARTRSEEARMEHEKELVEQTAQMDIPDDGFMEMMQSQAEEAFGDGFDEPANIGD